MRKEAKVMEEGRGKREGALVEAAMLRAAVAVWTAGEQHQGLNIPSTEEIGT